ncbi:protein COFACTOR ASSEMBLY OF COMPLEX C SUBUNIT B CCB4, chloroplastic-like isoform X2 [Selaginella moellendorffii]|uniref:protein COFACTOR ASSEMBLY OF COMPLEX C SUBUNIT B CCB4, chloroplastic-like isoform X2 n=1 Tax=Selaginella moellendorffii TaxID=88036 RepID=UPI000D1C422B|nr:protein COFACTOR ASSEMBLY OF COMPLEX C SUBUNIT B CCB4, chloroplastic-like isoform X2 [Selaginella moellendorffii]|eukprot:XP_024539620.1 protein COFACTOR ASSEMBLY OF COMPLEX C SUBUNIT B CCB4, chloroplastic-like isoform X2 [Selaginella moellendorffii]
MAMANAVFFVRSKCGSLSRFAVSRMPFRSSQTRCSFQKRGGGFETSEDWFSRNLAFVRAVPVTIGVGSFGFVFLNRTLSGVPLVAGASSSQSRADVLVVALAATVLLAGLVWISIQPRRFKPVELDGVQCMRVYLSSEEAKAELVWAWETMSKTTCCKSFVVLYKMRCVFQAGIAADQEGDAYKIDGLSVMRGTLCTAALASGKQSYLANLSLYPGRYELPFLPQNTQVRNFSSRRLKCSTLFQSVIIQPLGDSGVLILAGDTIRGFSPLDQVQKQSMQFLLSVFAVQIWITTLGQKLDATLETLQTFLGFNLERFLAAVLARSTSQWVLHDARRLPQALATGSNGMFWIKSSAFSSSPKRPSMSTMEQ